MARTAMGEARRAQIVTGMRMVMGREGYAGATIAKVAGVMGLTPGLVHYHFASKDEILLAVLEELEGFLQERFERRAGPGDSPARRLDAYLAAHLEQGEDADGSAVRAWVALSAEALHNQELTELYQRAVGRRRDLLEELLRARLAAEGRPTRGAPAMAAALLAALDGALWLGVLAPEAVPPGSALDSVRAMAEGLVAATPAALARGGEGRSGA